MILAISIVSILVLLMFTSLNPSIPLVSIFFVTLAILLTLNVLSYRRRRRRKRAVVTLSSNEEQVDPKIPGQPPRPQTEFPPQSDKHGTTATTYAPTLPSQSTYKDVSIVPSKIFNQPIGTDRPRLASALH